MGISAIYGKPGKGKSHFATYYGLHLANLYQKKLVSNFFFDCQVLVQYCRLMNYTWLLENIGSSIIYYIDCTESLHDILSIKDSVILLDEAAIFLPARGSSSNTPKQVMADLVQVRHDSQYLIYMAQSESQVDSFLRNLTEEVFHANGTSRWSPQLRNQALIWKAVHLFQPEQYQQWMSDPKIRKNPIKTKILATKSWAGALSCADMMLFDIYDSFNRLEAQKLQLGIQGDKLAYRIADGDKFPSILGKPLAVPVSSRLTKFWFQNTPKDAMPLELFLKIEGAIARFNKLERTICISALALIAFLTVSILGGIVTGSWRDFQAQKAKSELRVKQQNEKLGKDKLAKTSPTPGNQFRALCGNSTNPK